MKHLLLICLSSFLLLLTNHAMAQNDCPAYSPYSYFEESCFISANTAPTGQKMGGIWLPEASFDGKYGQTPNKAHIPDNRKTWAISIAHAWNYSRNILKQTDHPKMSYWMATVTQESEWRCDGQAKWGSFTGSPVGIPWFDQWQDGCYQIEGSNNGSAYGLLMEYYPLRFKINQHSNLISDNNFETSALVKAYYDLASERVATYRLGWKWNEAVNNACDPYAHEKLSASAYNGGIYAFQGAQTFITGQENNCYWTGLPSTTAGYPTQIGDLMAVLENNTTYPISTFKGATSTFDGYYSEKIAWSDLEKYFSEIAVLYHEINFQTQVIPNVEKAFIEVAGSKQNTVSFTALGPVIDAIILSLPKEDPLQTVTTSNNLPQGPNGAACSGDVVPVATIKVEGKTSFEEGLYTKLVANFDENKNYTIKWKLDGKTVGTEKELIVSNVAGTYAYGLEICDGTKCSIAECQKVITIQDVTTCNLLATTSVTNAVCKTSSEGQIIVNVQNGSGNYDVNYWLDGKQYFYKATSNTFTLKNLTSGIYGIEISDLASKSCKVNTNATVSYTIFSNQNLMISKNKATDCGAILTGELTTKPSAQKWRVRIYQPIYFSWENYVNVIIQTKNNTTFLQANEEGANPWEKEGNYYENFVSGDSITISGVLTNTPGAIQNLEIKVELYNEQNELKQTYTIPAQTLKNINSIYKIGTYNIQNSVSTPIYSYQWTPIQGVENPTKASTVVSAVNPLEGKYLLTATNPTNACTLKDSVILTYNCLKLCQGFNVEKFGSTATYKVCKGGFFEETITATGLNLTYQWYKNDKEFDNQTATLSITNASAKNEGLYRLKVKDACNQEDVTHNINLQVDVCTDIQMDRTATELVYPNPTNGKIIVDIEEEVQTLSLYSIDGKLLIQKNNSKEINLNEYSSGVYLLEIQVLTGKKTVKIYKN